MISVAAAVKLDMPEIHDVHIRKNKIISEAHPNLRAHQKTKAKNMQGI
jgi:hypothetical protein